MAEEKHTDDRLFAAKSLEEASAIRTHLMSSTAQLWVYVMKEDDKYSISVTNAHGGHLSEGMIAILQDSCQKFAVSREVDTVSEDDIDELGYMGSEV